MVMIISSFTQLEEAHAEYDALRAALTMPLNERAYAWAMKRVAMIREACHAYTGVASSGAEPLVRLASDPAAAADRHEQLKPDPVNHPGHYGGGDNPYEAIKVIDAWQLGFSLGNAVKYIARAGRKNPYTLREDLQKAVWYINHHIDQLGPK